MDIRNNARVAVTAGILALGAGSYGLLMAGGPCGPGSLQYAMEICGAWPNACEVQTSPVMLTFTCPGGTEYCCSDADPNCTAC